MIYSFFLIRFYFLIINKSHIETTIISYNCSSRISPLDIKKVKNKTKPMLLTDIVAF